MNTNQAISHYNRLEGVFRVIAELINDPNTSPEYKEDLNIVVGRLAAAQGKLPWSPERAVRTRHA